jgi:folate-binding protein YgfZ
MSEVTAAPARHLPLQKLHHRWGARFESRDGVQVPVAYTTVGEEYAALRAGCGLIDRSDVVRLELMGEDRHRFLNGLVTCDVKDLAPGQGAYGYFTDRQGKILADAVVLALEDRLWLELPPSAGDSIRAHLEKYIIADRVEVRPLDDLVVWTVAGLRAHEFIAGVSPEPLSDALWSHRKLTIAGSEVQLARQGRLGIDAWTLWCSASIGRPIAESLLERGAGLGLRAVGREALEIVRVEEGIGRFGQDFGPENFPQEVGEEEAAVSYTKGCYLGQEIVARIHYRGGVNHKLVRIALDSPALPLPGTPLLSDASEVGRITSRWFRPRREPSLSRCCTSAAGRRRASPLPVPPTVFVCGNALLDCEARTAAAAAGSVRVRELEAGALHAENVVDRGALEVASAHRVDENPETVETRTRSRSAGPRGRSRARIGSRCSRRP